MKVRYLNSFTRAFKKSSSKTQGQILEIISDLLKFITEKIRPPRGLGLTKLKRNLWEVRVGIRTRIIFSLEPNLVVFILIGSHDQMRKYLKNN